MTKKVLGNQIFELLLTRTTSSHSVRNVSPFLWSLTLKTEELQISKNWPGRDDADGDLLHMDRRHMNGMDGRIDGTTTNGGVIFMFKFIAPKPHAAPVEWNCQLETKLDHRNIHGRSMLHTYIYSMHISYMDGIPLTLHQQSLFVIGRRDLCKGNV